MRTFKLNAEFLAKAGIFFDIAFDGNIQITDKNEPMQLFRDEAIEELVAQFGNVRTDEMLSDAAEMIDAEMFARLMRNAKMMSR